MPTVEYKVFGSITKWKSFIQDRENDFNTKIPRVALTRPLCLVEFIF